MKMEFNAKIVGHELFVPDKDEPKKFGVRVKLQCASTAIGLGKPTKAVIPIEEKKLGQYPIGTYLRITVEDSQQVLNLAPERTKKAGATQLSMVREPKKRGGGGRRAPRNGGDHHGAPSSP